MNVNGASEKIYALLKWAVCVPTSKCFIAVFDIELNYSVKQKALTVNVSAFMLAILISKLTVIKLVIKAFLF